MKKLVEHYAGSILYGTNDETSDTDIRGVFIESLDNIMTNNRLSIYKDENEEDYELQELSRFLKMAYENNPNILETLFCPPKHIIYSDPIWETIYNLRHSFLSQSAITKFYGYINSQLKRMKKTNSWIRNMYSLDIEIINELGLNNQIELMDQEETLVENIIKEKGLNRIKYNMIVHPLHSEYLKVVHNFTGNREYNKTTTELIKRLNKNTIGTKAGDNTYLIYFDIINTTFLKEGMISAINKSDLADMGINISHHQPDMIIKFNKDLYENALKNYNGYYSWKSSKNSNRLELQKQSGYDTKFMMHIFRLYFELEDILTIQDIRVDRRGIDADFLYEVKKGKYSFEELIETIIPELDIKINKLIETNKELLPIEPTIDINQLELDIYKHIYNV